jgi:GTP-binding protein EngB required for normal cell division
MEETALGLKEETWLREALGALEEAATVLEHGRVAGEVSDIGQRLDAMLLEVAVVGEFKRGKSSLINALIGRDVLPVGVLPITTVPTIVERGEAVCEVIYRDGGTEIHPLETVARFVTEELNPGNRLGVDRVLVRLHSPLLDEGVRIADTPGVGSVFEHNTLSTTAYLPDLDAAVLVTSADPPISEGERAFLKDVLEHAVKLFVVLNKADYLSEDDLKRTVHFTERIVREAAPRWTGRVYPVSARPGMGDPAGLEKFRVDLQQFLREERKGTVVASAVRSVRTALSDLRVELEVERSAAAMTIEELSRRRDQFVDAVRLLSREASSDEALAEGAVRSALRALDEFSEMKRRDLEKAAREETLRRASELADASPSTLLERLQAERGDLLRRLASPIVSRAGEIAVDAFRTALAPILERAAARLRRLGEETASAFGISLPALELPEIDLKFERLRFSYARTLDTGTQLRTSAWRLLGGLGRRRAIEGAAEEARQEVGLLLGRIRGETFEQLTELSRVVLSKVHGHERELAQRLAEAIARGSGLLAEAERTRSHREQELARVESLLSSVEGRIG